MNTTEKSIVLSPIYDSDEATCNDLDLELCSISSTRVDYTLSSEMIQIEKQLVRKLDLIYVMPCLCILVVIQFFDKSALNYSAVLGIKEDTSLNDTEFGWLGSIFFIGYLLYQLPNAYLVQKLHVGRYLGLMIFTWGAILALTALSKNFFHLAVFRFGLGVFEAGVVPCTIMLISRVYRRSEQATRIGATYFSGGVAMTIGGVLSYGIGHMEGLASLRAWQWVMMILGCTTVVFGTVCFFVLIDDATAIATTEKERAVVEARSRDNAVIVSRQVNYAHVWEALKEGRFYCFVVFSFLVSLQNGALSTFSSSITKGFGYSNLNAILLGISTGVMNCIFIATAVFCQRKFANSLLYTAIVLILISILGLLLLVVLPIQQAKLLGLYLCYSYVAAISLVMTSLSNNVSGYTKKIFYNSAIVVFSTVGNFIGPQLMISAQKPLYIGGMTTYIIADMIGILLLLVARSIMAKANLQRLANQKLEGGEEQDVTDQQDERFIYTL